MLVFLILAIALFILILGSLVFCNDGPAPESGTSGDHKIGAISFEILFAFSCVLVCATIAAALVFGKGN